MPRKRQTLTFVQAMQKMHSAGLDHNAPPNRPLADEVEALPTLQERLSLIFNLVNNKHRPPSNMLFFVMYDIESNKVRRQVVKYLERQGCSRVQKSTSMLSPSLGQPCSFESLSKEEKVL